MKSVTCRKPSNSKVRNRPDSIIDAHVVQVFNPHKEVNYVATKVCSAMSAYQFRTIGGTMVMPFARALSLLDAFDGHELWLSNSELCASTGLAPSTVSRLAQSLVRLGYLYCSPTERKYRLTAHVLALGYAATANSSILQAAREHMRDYAERYGLHVALSARDRLDLIILESVHNPDSPLILNIQVGTRFGLGSSPIGWALLAALPELERYYLLENVERRSPQEWRRIKHQCNAGIADTFEMGFCMSSPEKSLELSIVACPLQIEGQAPHVISCIGRSDQLSRQRVLREFGPRLRSVARAIQNMVSLHE